MHEREITFAPAGRWKFRSDLVNRRYDKELSYEITRIVASTSAEHALQGGEKRSAHDESWHEARQALVWEAVITGMNEMLRKYDLSTINGGGNIE